MDLLGTCLRLKVRWKVVPDLYDMLLERLAFDQVGDLPLASLRGSAGFAAFAGAKHGLRSLAQSMARELGPQGIHVAHVVIDGAIDTPFFAERFPERYALKAQDGILSPDAIAETYWQLHRQHRSAWTHELDLRPWMEKW